MFCIHCGKNNPDIASFCFNCGSKLIKEEYKEESIETNVSVAKNDLIENASYEKEKRKGMEIYLYDIAMLEHGILKADEKVRTLRQKKISMSKKIEQVGDGRFVGKYYPLDNPYSLSLKNKIRGFHFFCYKFPQAVYRTYSGQERKEIFGDRDYGIFVNDARNVKDEEYSFDFPVGDKSVNASLVRLDDYCFISPRKHDYGPLVGYKKIQSVRLAKFKPSERSVKEYNYFHKRWDSKDGDVGIELRDLPGFLSQLESFFKDFESQKASLKSEITEEENVLMEKETDYIHQITAVEKDINNAKTLLANYYNVNIIPTKYRNIAAISYLLDYYRSSNVSLDDIFFHLDLNYIEQNQKRIISQNRDMVFSQYQIMNQNAELVAQNQRALQHLSEISTNSREAAQWQEIAARNSKATAWFAMANYLK